MIRELFRHSQRPLRNIAGCDESTHDITHIVFLSPPLSSVFMTYINPVNLNRPLLFYRFLPIFFRTFLNEAVL